MTPVDSDAACLRIQRTTCWFALALFAATWKLWTPQTEFPAVPLWSFARHIPVVVEWTLACVVVVLSVCLVRPQHCRRTLWLAWTICLAGLFLENQHRLQPWAWQFVLYGVVFAIAPGNSVSLLRCLTISIYAHSAASKCYPEFEPIAKRFAETSLRLFGQSAIELGGESVRVTAIALPAVEFLVAFLLAFAATRRWGRYASLFLHASLIALLGPWGMNHSWSVLLWNAFFIVQNLLLFPSTTDREIASTAKEQPIRMAAVTAFIGVAVVLPVLFHFGYWDRWPSWAVYAGSSRTVTIEIPIEKRTRLPASAAVTQSTSGRCMVHVDRWSLNALGVPVYPQTRFRIAVALAVSEMLEDEEEPAVTIVSEAPPLRSRHTIIGRPELETFAERYSVNAIPKIAHVP